MTRPLPDINADIKAHSASATAINAINKAVTLICVLVAALGIWALDQAEQHYQQQDKVNQEVLAKW
jgi:hypothetical protein